MTATNKVPPVLGIPVEYDERLPVISEVAGIGPWKKILVGPDFLKLDHRCAGAVLLHEAGHVKLRHLEKRIGYALLNFWRPMAIGRYCREQEFQADAFAAGCGYGRDLALVFSRTGGGGGTYHPPNMARVIRLLATPTAGSGLTNAAHKA